MALDWGWFIVSELGFGIQGLFPAFTILAIVSVAGLERIGKDRVFVFIGSTFEMVLFYVFLLATANSNTQEPADVTLYYQFTEHWPLAFLVCLIIIFYFCILAGYKAPLKIVSSWVRKVMDRTQQNRPDRDRPLN
jgi:hypothetical protein